MVKVIGISDLHGYLPPITDEFDIMLIGGDICPAHDHNHAFQREWLSTKFVEWVMKLPFKDTASKVIFIGGNHDVFLCEEPNPNRGVPSLIETDIIRPCGGRLVYLEDDEYTYESLDGETLRIYGTPWCKIFGSWWFMQDDKTLKKTFDAIPKKVDILLTHDSPAIPPYGFITEGPFAGKDAGNKVLAKAIKKRKPRYAFAGHIHSSPGEVNKIHGIVMCCLSIMDENYRPIHPIHIFDIEGNKSVKGRKK